jgi:hypothetical protein
MKKKQKTMTLLHKIRAHYERPVTAGNAGKSNPATAASKAIAADKQVKNGTGKNNTSKNSQLSRKQTTEQEALKQDKSNINDERIRRRYE